MALFHTIVHPTDFDAHSLEAFRVARTMALHLGARVVALHIAAPPAVVTGDGRVIRDPKDPNPVDLWGDYRAAQTETPGVVVQQLVMVGHHSEATRMLMEMIKHDPAGSLIVMGTHGRTGMSRFLWGNKAEEVVLQAPCSVLVVKGTAAG
jgi:nucleotide-binding universal stress UspA family protein